MQIRTAYKGPCGLHKSSFFRVKARSSCLFHLPHEALLDSEEEDALREEGGQSEYDPTERILSQEINLESSELRYEDLFKDTEDCGAKVNEGVARRVNSACTTRPAKE